MTVNVIRIGGIDATLDGLVETTADWGTIRGRARPRSNAAFERSGAGARYTGATYPVDTMTVTHKIVAPVGQREYLLEVLRGTWYAAFTPAPGDDEVELAFGDFAHRRVELILAVLVADARRADRAHEGHARQRQRSRSRDHRQDIGLILAVIAQHLTDYVDFVVETFGE